MLRLLRARHFARIDYVTEQPLRAWRTPPHVNHEKVRRAMRAAIAPRIAAQAAWIADRNTAHIDAGGAICAAPDQYRRPPVPCTHPATQLEPARCRHHGGPDTVPPTRPARHLAAVPDPEPTPTDPRTETRAWRLRCWDTTHPTEKGQTRKPFHDARIVGDHNLNTALKNIEARYTAHGAYRHLRFRADPA